jgi:hypothetical protein
VGRGAHARVGWLAQRRLGAVWALTTIGGWWMLAAAMLVHLAMTFVVMIEVTRVIDGHGSGQR